MEVTQTTKQFILVEDDPINAFVFKRLLLALYPEANFIHYISDQLFLDNISTFISHPDIIYFFDLHINEGSGYTLKNTLDKLSENDNIPTPKVYAFTASLMDEIDKKCKEAGFRGIITKPPTLEKLKLFDI